ncbi:MAG: GntR family transcriptional regulator [Clostridiaceae bacterium]|nr:GntR family transcriptional regulator [Clostridiaceae bacterium]
MSYKFDESQPIYLQLIEIFKTYIANGAWKAGEKIESVRNLALDFAVNPNTVQRALVELENIGLAYSQRTTGRFITQNQEKINNLKHEMAENKTRDFVIQMQAIDIEQREILDLVQRCLDSEEITNQQENH